MTGESSSSNTWLFKKEKKKKKIGFPRGFPTTNNNKMKKDVIFS